MNGDKKPKTADWAPGTLEATRRAIGEIDPEEAKRMSQKLGGEVMYERSETETMKIPSRNRNAGRIIRQDSYTDTAARPRTQAETQEPARNRRGQAELPIISQKNALKINKLMMSDEYKIKPNYGLFNFIKRFQRDGHEQIIPEFFSYTIKQHVDGIEAFITVIKTLIQIAPAPYKVKIAANPDAKFRFLRIVASWQIQPLRLLLLEIQNLPQPYYVSDLTAITRAIYRLLVQVYYYGENQIPKLIKDIYTDEAKYPESPNDRLASLAKEAITNWLYLQSEVMKKHYPLLMRMCQGNYDTYPQYFKSNVAEILRFVGMHKYDLLLPERAKTDEPKEEAKPEKPKEPEIGARDKIVDAGIVLLDQLFPEAGFKTLEKHPDLYPYFQPLYKFADGFNVVSPENPLHVTVVLLRILEDFLTGCRNIKFSVTSLDGRKTASDSILTVIDEWTAYRETVFESLYCTPLKDLVNETYSQRDFENTLFGKKLLTSLLWQTRYHFLPNFTFNQLLLERSPDESKMTPLFRRTDFVRKFLMEAVAQCDRAVKAKGPVEFLANPWEHYKFDLPNEVSKRIDVFLGAQNTSDTTQATNANLLKYTLCVISVLDWWLNNPESPAYTTPAMHIYRIDPKDDRPMFSIPERNDQNKLFADAVRAAFQKKTESGAEGAKA